MRFQQIITLTAVLASLLLISCASQDSGSDAQRIIDRTIDVHGGDRYMNSVITFTFRDIHYTARRDNGIFSLEREFSDERGHIHDILNNDGFTRRIDGAEIQLDEEDAGRYARSVNAVIYFTLLPYKLNDPGVFKELLGTEMIGGTEYHKIEVTFAEEGGGDDHEDVFMFWIHTSDYTMDYFAYQYFTDGGGIRFRETINPRTVNGIMFTDHNNFSPADPGEELAGTAMAFEEGRLELVSVVELENVDVRISR